jgi:site-specific DNA recombinase
MQPLKMSAVSEEALEATELLGWLRFDAEVLEWVRDAHHASHADERREHEEAIRRHQAEHKRLDKRIHAMYVDKLDGLVDAAFFEHMSNQWREEQNRCFVRLNACKRPIAPTWTRAHNFLSWRGTHKGCSQSRSRAKRRLLNFLLSNCTWEDGEVVATFRSG